MRQIEAHITNTVGWSATTGRWIRGCIRTFRNFVLDDADARRLAELNPQASMRMANRLLEASDRDYWTPDEDTLARAAKRSRRD